ncbi:MAG: hypothetical protein AAFY80_08040 [Pseudomonadota bacterium]
MDRTSWGKTGASLLACAAIFGLNTPLASAQDAGGLNVTADVRSSLTIDDNADLDVDSEGTTSEFDTRLTLGVAGGSATSRFEAELGGSVRFEDRPGGEEEDNGFVDPFAALRFDAEGVNTEFGVNLRVRETEVLSSFFIDEDGDFIADDLIVDEGDLLDSRATLTFSVGVNSPLGADFRISRRERDYTDTVDPNLFDRSTDTARAAVNIQLSPLATASLIGTYREYDAEDAVETNIQTTGLGVGLRFDFTPVLRFNGEVLTNEFETTESGVTTEEDSQTSGFLRLTRELPDGEVRFEARSDASSTTNRTTLSANREIEVAGSEIGYGLGFTDSDTGDSAVLVNLNFSRDLPLGRVSAELDQRAVINDDEEEVLRTRVALGLLREIGEQSALDVSLSVADVEDIGNGLATEATRTEFQIGLRRQIFEQWDWTLAYRARFESEPGADTAQSNAIITTIGRTFSLR